MTLSLIETGCPCGDCAGHEQAADWLQAEEGDEVDVNGWSSHSRAA